MIVPLALVVGGVGTLFTITHLTINIIYQAKQPRQNIHKINTNDNTKIMQSMQTCKMAIFIVQIFITRFWTLLSNLWTFYIFKITNATICAIVAISNIF